MLKLPTTAARRALPALVMALIATLNSHTVRADSSFGGLVGTASPGLTIAATNRETGATRVTTADKEGRYSVLGLPAGEYVVTASNGASAVVTVAVATTVTYNFVAAGKTSAAKPDEEITVYGARVMDFQDPEVGQIVTMHDINTLPQLNDNFLNFADIVPGVQVMNTNGGLSLRGGANAPGNANIMIDGVSNKDYVSGNLAGGGAQNGVADQGNPFPQAAIAEYKVISSNYSAQYTDATSVIIAAQSASGTNTFKGSVSADFTNQNMRAMTPVEANTDLSSPKAKNRTVDYALSLGGPIVRDKLHWFVAYQRKDYQFGGVVAPDESPSPITGAAAPTISQYAAILPASITSQWGPISLPFTEDLGFGKLDFEPTGTDRIELTTQIRSENQTTATSTGSQSASAITGTPVARSGAVPISSGDNRFGLDWVHAGKRWTNDLKIYSDHNYQTAAKPEDQIPQNLYVYVGDGSYFNTVLSTGALGNGFRSNQKMLGLTDDFTLPNLEWLGTHTLKAGVRVQALSLRSQSKFTSPTASFATFANTTGLGPNPTVAAVFGVNPAGAGCVNCAAVSSSDRQYGIYLEDDWTINHHLTLSLGARYDYEIIPTYLHWVTPQAIAASFQNTFPGTTETYAQALALGGVNINDYISNGRNRSSQSNQIQPRIGFTYDINGDDKYVLYGGYGRSYDRGAFANYASEQQSLSNLGNGFFNVTFPVPPGYGFLGQECTAPDPNFSGGPCVPWNPAYLTNPALLAPFVLGQANLYVNNVLSSNHLKDPRTDQLSLGLRTRQGEWVMSGTVVYQQTFDLFAQSPGRRNPDGSFFLVQGNSYFYQDGQVDLLNLQNNDGRNESTQLELSLVKPYTKESRWNASLAYTYSMAWQNGGDSYWPNQGSQGVLAGSTYASVAYNDGPSGRARMRPSASVPRHLIVATYGQDLPWNMNVAFKISLETPTPVYMSCDSQYDPQCPVTPGTNQTVVTGHIHELFMYRDVDMQLTKTFDLAHGLKPYVRLDVLNLFDSTNYDPAYVTSFNEVTGVASNAGNPALLGPPFTAKLSAGMSW